MLSKRPSDPNRLFLQHLKRGVLAWPAWLRILLVAPAVVVLWLAVLWADLETTPW